MAIYRKGFVQYGVGLPYTAVKALVLYPHIKDVVFAAWSVSAAMLVLSATLITTPLCRARWLAMIAAGFALALAGYDIFFIRGRERAIHTRRYRQPGFNDDRARHRHSPDWNYRPHQHYSSRS